VAAGAGAEARGNFVSRRGNSGASQRKSISKDMTREMGKVLAETPRRRARSHRHDVLQPAKAEDFLGRRLLRITEQVAMSVRQSIGVVRNDYAVEFSDGDSVVENVAGAGERKYSRAEAGGRHAAFFLSLYSGR